ncbi:unnamed protein product [Rhizoctonia solani]|uniref:Uncharacterized protein n=1 Tax=Rhizoctonia solani TaxID=456999 RepID=A0A8H3CIK5_9AGAM|nr:unnamed protein product [Rhizoctonia solani]
MGQSQTQKANRYIISPPIPPSGARVKISSDAEKEQLSQAKKAVASQIGPCSLELTFGTSKRVLRFPYPISHTNLRVSIKKSEYQIDVTAPISKPIEASGYPFSPFPVIQHPTPSPWNVHHVHIDRMPKFDIKNQEKIKGWLVSHTALQMSDRERIIQRSTSAANRRTSEALTNFKESMIEIILDYVGIRDRSQGRHSSFVLIEPAYGTHTVIMVSGLRLDLSGTTFVLDCAILPVTESTLNIKHLEAGDALHIQTRPVEVPTWKNLLPAFVERSRTWPHKGRLSLQV